jgi:predicted O-methyltransferase YrrM
MRLSSENAPTLQYIESLFASEDEELLNIKKSIEINGLRAINISPYEGKILNILLQVHQAVKVVEVGTLVGYSTTWIARALPENGKVYSFEKGEKIANIARENISKTEIANKVEIISGDAHEMLKTIENKAPFDAIFIDAEKTGYLKYLEWADKNIRIGGLIIADNVLYKGKVAENKFENSREEKTIKAIREFNEAISDNKKYQSIILPTLEGLSVSIKLF